MFMTVSKPETGNVIGRSKFLCAFLLRNKKLSLLHPRSCDLTLPERAGYVPKTREQPIDHPGKGQAGVQVPLRRLGWLPNSQPHSLPC
jgi:hypothetical protein